MGRPKVNEKELKKAINLYKSEQYSVSEIVEMTGISRATIEQSPPSSLFTSMHIMLCDISCIKLLSNILNSLL
ncbi:helix-turn-helix domain-containing protein [Cytobacillus praedii]|uniref:helix-turn-helix domain-containing protein n=1 Tax=Cytobacillus praedii TaxID=1742358 RepID=UPI002E238791|nr:helix-turn-helix domain-containing protein [Cytobacillus praedii]